MNEKAFYFDWVMLVPILLIVFGLIEVFFLAVISPFNYLFALIIFALAGFMFWRMHMFSRQPSPKESFQPSREEPFARIERDTPKSPQVTPLEEEEDGKKKISLDEFILSSPKEFMEKTPAEKAPKKHSGKDYKKMKEDAFKELQEVVKPSKKKTQEELEEIEEEDEEF
ncbi:hypothetical protein KJ660_03725 [Candidatus Micrarchaeota archaeon]|nr:hypothetical protein [Candidatus Micrarchaeota archaeon]